MQSIRDDLPGDCPSCGEPSLRPVLHPPTILDATPRTIGTLAERNNSDLGRYKLDSLRQAQAERKELARDHLRENLPDGMSLARDGGSGPAPWWRPGGAVNTDLAALPPEKQANYVMTGDTRG